MVRWMALTTLGVAWLLVIPGDTLGGADVLRLTPGFGLTLAELIGVSVTLLAWLYFVGNVLRIAHRWRGDARCRAHAAAAALLVVASGAACVVGAPALLILFVASAVTAHVALAIRTSQL